MKQPEDFSTAELPGMPVPKRRGRRPVGERSMTPAERQKAYRARLAETRYENRPEEMSRVTLLDQLASSLRAIDAGDDLKEGAEWLAENLIREIVTRYKLKSKRCIPSRVTKS